MDLPLVDEIREARRLAEEATDARNILPRVHSALTALGLLETHLQRHPDIDVDLPAGDLVEELAERWADLADLPSSGPRPSQPLTEQVRLRKQQMQAALQHLSPLARTAKQRNAELHQLQHEQREQLDDPKYADEVGTLARIGTQRETVTHQLQPLKQRQGSLEPAQRVLDTFLDQIDELRASHSPVPGYAAWQAAMITNGMVDTLVQVYQHLGLDMPLPTRIDLPDEPDPDQADELEANVEQVHQELKELRDVFAHEAEGLDDRIADLEQRYDELTARIVDRMG